MPVSATYRCGCGTLRGSGASADPYREVVGLQGLLYDRGQVIADRVQVYGVFEPCCERGRGLVGVVAGAVEPAVHHVLHPQPQRVEQGRRGQG